jgi:hypothetical protein
MCFLRNSQLVIVSNHHLHSSVPHTTNMSASLPHPLLAPPTPLAASSTLSTPHTPSTAVVLYQERSGPHRSQGAASTANTSRRTLTLQIDALPRPLPLFPNLDHVSAPTHIHVPRTGDPGSCMPPSTASIRLGMGRRTPSDQPFSLPHAAVHAPTYHCVNPTPLPHTKVDNSHSKEH